MRLKEKIAVVTGGSQGLGMAIARRFLAEGAKVVVADIQPLTYDEPEMVYYPLDISDSAGCERFASWLKEQYGRLDILVNNAGITDDAITGRMTDEQFDRVLQVNLKGTFRVTRSLGRLMEEQKKGSIIILSSIAAEFGSIGQANYTATKGGLMALTRTWAKEYARKGADIRVNCIAPGFMLTEALQKLPQEWKDKHAKMTMLGRLGQPEDIASAALFLATEESAYITGHTLDVNGGMRL